jgi:hypothetical protein
MLTSDPHFWRVMFMRGGLALLLILLLSLPFLYNLAN